VGDSEIKALFPVPGVATDHSSPNTCFDIVKEKAVYELDISETATLAVGPLCSVAVDQANEPDSDDSSVQVLKVVAGKNHADERGHDSQTHYFSKYNTRKQKKLRFLLREQRQARRKKQKN
jgi:hypothetical protein